MADLPLDFPLPAPESDDLGRYLEDTITIDWQTPSVMETGRRLLSGLVDAEARVERLFRFVRDEIADGFDLEEPEFGHRAAAGSSGPGSGVGVDVDLDVRVGVGARAGGGASAELLRRGIACRASEVLTLGHGVSFAKSHLLAALLRIAGHPTGFCYARLVDPMRSNRFMLHGFVACHWQGSQRWILLDPLGDRPQATPPVATVFRFAEPYSLARVPEIARGESLLPFVYQRPARRIVDWLERVPDRKALRRTWPDALG